MFMILEILLVLVLVLFSVAAVSDDCCGCGCGAPQPPTLLMLPMAKLDASLPPVLPTGAVVDPGGPTSPPLLPSGFLPRNLLNIIWLVLLFEFAFAIVVEIESKLRG